MANNPTSKNQSFGYIEAFKNIVGGSQEARVQIELGTASVPPDGDTNRAVTTGSFLARNSAVTVSFRIQTRAPGQVLAQTGRLGVGFYVFRDNQDGGGIGTNRVEFIQIRNDVDANFPAGNTWTDITGGTGTVSISAGTVAQPGTYKVNLVLFAIDDAGEPITGNVTDGGVGNAINEYYIDADNNVDSSAGPIDAPALTSFRTGRAAWMRVQADAQSLTASVSPNQTYPNQPTITVDITAAAGLNNPKQLRLGPIQPAQATTVSLVKTLTVTPPSNGGSVTSSAYNVDTLFPTSMTTHRLRVVVGPRAGQASTLAGEIPDLLSAGTLVLVDTNDKAWVVFGTPASGLTKKDDFVVESDTNLSIGSGIKVFKDTAITTTGVGSFDSSGYTTSRVLFRRAKPSGTFNDTPFLETFVTDQLNNKLSGVSTIITTRRHSDLASENSQTLSTGTGGTVGRIRWNYQIANTHTAFNRFKKSAADNPNSPPATFAGSPTAGPHPAYPKTVRVLGNAFAGTNEPSIDTSSVFGVNSETHVEDVWTGDLANATIDANGEPTGAAKLTKNLGTGGMRWKLSTSINRATGLITNAGEHNPKTVDGQSVPVTVAANNIKQRRAVYNQTTVAVEDSPANSSIELSTSTGYDTSPTDGFESKDASGGPRTLNLCMGFSAVSAQRDTFDLTGNPEVGGTWNPNVAPNGNIGFTGDTGNYGYFLIRIQFVAVDPDMAIVTAISNALTSNGTSVRIVAKFGRFQPDGTFIDLKPDSPPNIKIGRSTGSGIALTFESETVMTAINPDGNGKSPDWEHTFTPTIDSGAYGVIITGIVSGIRPPSPGRVSFNVLSKYDPIALALHNTLVSRF